MKHATPETAYLACAELRARYTFEQAMAAPDIARALRCTAEAMNRARAALDFKLTAEEQPA